MIKCLNKLLIVLGLLLLIVVYFYDTYRIRLHTQVLQMENEIISIVENKLVYIMKEELKNISEQESQERIKQKKWHK